MPAYASESTASPTRLACLTPPGAGAIATLAIRGPGAWSVVRSLFTPKIMQQPPPGSIYFGRLGQDSQAADDVVLAVKDDVIEIHCHGGGAVVAWLQELFVQRGVLPCAWQELADAETPLTMMALEQLLLRPR